MMSMNLSDIAILKIQGSDYGCISNLISEKSEKSGTLQNVKVYYHILKCLKKF